ncbi:hypothetical protein BH11CYA1_BH11CYA1_23260 [soil metagenome]
MISSASIQTVLAQATQNFAAGEKFEQGKAIDEARFHYGVALASLEVIASIGTSGQYCVATPCLGVITSDCPDVLFRVCQSLARLHDRIGRIELTKLNTTVAARHLAAAQAGYEAHTVNGVKAFELSVLLAEAHVRGGNAEGGLLAAKSAVRVIEKVVGYCSPSVVYAYYWLYRSESMLLNCDSAAAAADRMLALLDANPDVINSGTANLLRREVSQLTF